MLLRNCRRVPCISVLRNMETLDEPIKAIIEHEGRAEALDRTNSDDPKWDIVVVDHGGHLEAILVGVADCGQDVAFGAPAAVQLAIAADLMPLHPPATVHPSSPALPALQAPAVPKVAAEEAAGLILGASRRAPDGDVADHVLADEIQDAGLASDVRSSNHPNEPLIVTVVVRVEVWLKLRAEAEEARVCAEIMPFSDELKQLHDATRPRR